jgi:hypothetical protein
MTAGAMDAMRIGQGRNTSPRIVAKSQRGTRHRWDAAGVLGAQVIAQDGRQPLHGGMSALGHAAGAEAASETLVHRRVAEEQAADRTLDG